MRKKNNGGRSHLFHIPGTPSNFTLDETVEIIDPSTHEINGRMTIRKLLEKFG
jgi:hypothetical protein